MTPTASPFKRGFFYGAQMASEAEKILMALAAKRADELNSSPFSQFINAAGAEAGGKLAKIPQSILNALMVPGRVASGEIPFDPYAGFSGNNNQGMIEGAADLAGVVSLGSAPLPRPSSVLSMGSNLDNWFGRSQVANPDGTPMRLYHGTTGNFDTFNIPKDGAGNPRAAYLTPDPAVASQYAAGKGSVIPAYVKADKLLTVDFQGAATDALGRGREAVVREARANGHDGVLLKNTSDVGGVQDQYAVFNPAQIKSAVGNNGNFNPNDPSIVRMSGVPIVPGSGASEDDLDVLAWTMLGEAGGEGAQGMSDVGHVILNRLNNGKYGASISDVAKAPKQFSTWNSGAGGNNPSGRYPKDSAEFKRARELASQVVAGTIPGPPGRPLDYNASNVSPYWADSKSKHGTYERNGHVFYPSVPVPPGEIPNTVGTALSTSRTPPAVPPRRPDTLVSGLRNPTSAGDGLALNPVDIGRQPPPMFDGEYSALNQGMMRMPAPAASWGMNQERTPFPAMPSPQMAGLRATRPDTQLAANQAAEQLRSRANIGQPPGTRSAQSIPMPPIPSLSPSPPRGGSSVMDDYAYNTQPFMPRVNANAPDRLVAEAGIPELFGNGRVGGIGGNAVAPIPFNRPSLAMLPPLANPMQLPTAEQLAAATGFRAPPMQMPGLPPMPFARPNRAPMPMPANMRPFAAQQSQRPPLNILVQGSNTIRPQLTPQQMIAAGNAAVSQSGDDSSGNQRQAAQARASGDAYRASRR